MISSNKVVQHLQASCRLIHRHHVTSFINSIKREIFVHFILSRFYFFHFSISELISMLPLQLLNPIEAPFPIANVIFVSIVHQYVNSFIKQIGHHWSSIDFKIGKQSQVHFHITTLPISSWNSKFFLHIFSIQKNIQSRKIITQRRNFTFFSYIIHIKSRSNWQAQNRLHYQIAEVLVDNRHFIFDQEFANSEANIQGDFAHCIYQLIMVRKWSVARILIIRIYPTISNSYSLQINTFTLVLLSCQHISNERNVMTGVRLSSDVKVSAFELGIQLIELGDKNSELFSDFVFIFGQVENASVRVTSANGLVYVEQVGIVVPRNLIFHRKTIF